MESGNAGEVGRARLGEEPRYQAQRPTWEHEDWSQSFLHGVHIFSPRDGEWAGISNSGRSIHQGGCQVAFRIRQILIFMAINNIWLGFLNRSLKHEWVI